MPSKVKFISILVFLGLFLTVTQLGLAQSVNGPLNFGNNYFVTGDYVVAGAQGMNTDVAGGYAIGTITVPDPNPGITGAKSVPPGAEVVAALLYWQTVEKTGTVPGQAGSGENGYFMPVVAGGPKAPGYPITGVELASSDTVAFSSGGCTGSSTGKLVRTYRANVLAALPRDPTGNISANGIYEVFLPSVGNSTPLTLGASLVLIYRILNSPAAAPLNAIVIYDGAYAPSTGALTMKQTVQGFYKAASGPVSRLTHIVGQGKSNKFETVYLNNTQLPSLYGREPSFPGYYGTWDNPTWTFNPNESYVKVANPIPAGAPSATTEVMPASSQQGCVSWGAMIVSTTVASSDGDGLVDAWKVKPANSNYPNPGYCDASVNEGACAPGSASWVDLPGAMQGEKDVFIQLDYMCSSPTGGDSCTTGDGTNYSFDPRMSGAVNLVINAFNPTPANPAHPAIHVHINPCTANGTDQPCVTNQPDVHAIQEAACTDASTTELCAFPGQPGVVAWKGGFDVVKNQLVDSTSGQTADCAVASPPATCVPRFQPGRRTSWHYVLAAHAVGEPKWNLQDGTLETVKQSGKTVTFTTSAAVGTLTNVNNIKGDFTQDPSCPDGRVTILGAASNPNLNGTFCLASAANPAGTTFTITVSNSETASYTYATDPNLAVAPGVTGSASGVSDVGGEDSLITLGLWGNPADNGHTPDGAPASDGQTESVQAGTFMHELGHSIGLTHGGYTYAQGTYIPTLGPNCKPNFQSVMNYSFQTTLLTPLNNGTPVPDYSGQALPSLSEGKATTAGVLSGTSYLNTVWYTPYTGVGNPVTIHCDGSPNPKNTSMSQSDTAASALSWAADQDINFDGNSTEVLQGYNDWANIDLRQIGATGTNSSAGGELNWGGGGQNLGGGGQNLGGGGQNLGGGGQNFGGGGQNLGGGGQSLGGGGQNLGGGGEQDVIIANAATHPPQNSTAQEGSAPRYITVFWNAPSFGQIGAYKVYRAVNGIGSFTVVGTVSGAPPALTYVDMTATCNQAGYEYFVTAVLSANSANPGQESAASNIVTTGTNGIVADEGKLTGCYTNTPPTVSLTSLAVATNSVVQGTPVNVTWSLEDDYNYSATPPYVTNLATNSLVAIGPFPSDQGCPASLPAGGTITQLLTSGTPGFGASAFTYNSGTNQFTFNLDTTNLNAGCYWFQLTLDSTQTETTTSPLAVQIYVSDTAPHVTTTTLPPGVVGNAYNNTIYESGGIGSLTWSYTGSIPNGISLNAGTGALSGTTCLAGNYNFTAKVTDSKSNVGTQGLMLQINQASTTTFVTSTLMTSTYGQMVTFNATVSPQYGCTPTGTVTFYDGNAVLGPAVNLSNATASFTTSATQLGAGMHSITVVYNGDPNFTGSTSQVLTQTVNKAYTTSSVVSSLNPSVYGQQVMFTATVKPQYAGTPSGSVTFYDGNTVIGSAIGLSSASTSIQLQLAAGMHPITAVYSGDSNFYATSAGGSTDPVLSQTVTQATTNTTVTSSPSASTTYGQAVTFTATVAPQYAGVPSGSVTFYDGINSIGNPVSLSSATASFTTTATQLAVGTHSITATYSGDPNFYATNVGGSMAQAATQTVTPAPLTATVSGNESSAPPTFMVTGINYATFAGSDTSSAVNGTLSCDVVVPSGGGTAGSNPISCTGLSAANYNITYDYSGLTPIAAATRATLTVNVTGTVTLGSPNTFTVTSYTLSGLLNSDTSAVVTGTPTCTVLAEDSSHNYPISCTGLSVLPAASTSYNIIYSYSYGTTAIPPAPLTVAVNGSVNTSGATPVFTINSLTYSGFINKDTPSVVSGALSCSLGTPNPTNYPIACLGLTASSYNVSYDYTSSPGTDVVSPTPLIVSVTGTESTSPSPAFTIASYTYSGFVNGDTPATAVTGSLSCISSTTADAAGNYPINCSGLSAANYTITYSYSPGIGSVSASTAPLTLVVSGTVPSGNHVSPPLTITSVTYTGFVNGDTLSAITGTLSCTTRPGPSAIPPSFLIATCSGVTAPGYYTFYYVTGTITVIPAP